MPVPSVITDLSATAASNSPSGADSINVADDHLRVQGAFIRQLYDGTYGGGVGTLSLNFGTAAINFCPGQFYKDASGNFGIGTSSPSSRLHVSGGTITQTNATDGSDGIFLKNAAGTLIGQLYGFGTSYLYIQAGASQGSLRLAAPNASAYVNIEAGGAERFRVKPTGQFKTAPLSAAPSGAEEGDIYYNSVTKKHYGYDGTTWNALY